MPGFLTVRTTVPKSLLGQFGCISVPSMLLKSTTHLDGSNCYDGGQGTRVSAGAKIAGCRQASVAMLATKIPAEQMFDDTPARHRF